MDQYRWSMTLVLDLPNKNGISIFSKKTMIIIIVYQFSDYFKPFLCGVIMSWAEWADLFYTCTIASLPKDIAL